MISYIRKSRWAKVVSLTLAFSFVSEVIFPTVALALTGGPSQPEVESFAPIEATDMVDLFSGDFKYNIPLLDVDGYPINLNYNSNITMDQEASWVGLGWNLNPGVINRSMRGLPDEFCGDLVTKEFNIAKDETYGVTLGVGDIEIFGVNGLDISVNLGVKWNSIQGMGIDFSVAPTISLGELAQWSNNKINSSEMSKAKKAKYGNICKRIKKYSELVGRINSSDAMKWATGGAPFLRELELGPTMNSICRNPISYIKYGVLNKTPTFTPEVQSSLKNSSETYNGKVGGSIIGIDGNVSFTGYHSKHETIKAPAKVPAYGYMNTDQGMKGDACSLLDFNRENDGSFSENLAYLPLTNYTYDSYSILGQGLTGSFRAHRGAVDVLFDQVKYNLGESDYLGAEVAPGNIIHVGVDKSSNNVYGVSGLWVDNNYALPALVKNYYGQSKDFEKAYFKEAGEMNVEENTSSGDFYQKIGKNSATKLQLVSLVGGSLMSNLDHYSPGSSTSEGFNKSIQRERRAKRLTNISYLSPKEASVIGINKEILDYPFLTTGTNAVTSNGNDGSVNRTPRTQKPNNHVSEISVTKSDGNRYIYGIPAYNNKQVESSFSVGLVCCNQPLDKGMVMYNPQDDSYENGNGKDHFYSKTTLPPYPHSYLLTAVLSPDYIDLTGDGPTEDDLGNYVKYNYSKLSKNYNWRSPLSSSANMASYSKGQNHTSSDDRGSYTYGEKEVWYLQSIETKNQIAEFYLSDRKDGCGVKNSLGEIDYNGTISPRLKQLDKISLYSKRDRKLEETDLQHKAVPIKEVHFVYTNSLCKNIPNSITMVNPNSYTAKEKGKLTLTQVYFTYGNSNKGKFNSYKFDYNENDPECNPDYNNKAYDRWGNYMPLNQSKISGFTAIDCPYVNQSKVSGSSGEYLVDKWSSVWSLRKIELPSGGEINVKYEADDYAYVQDKRATEMYEIAGVTYNSDPNPIGKATLHDKSRYASCSTHLQVYFKLNDQAQNSTYSNDELKSLYFNGLDDLYFSCSMKLDKHNGNDVFEQVNGYAQISRKEIQTIGSVKYGVLTLTDVRINNEKGGCTDYTNPFTKAGINYCLNNAPYIVSEDDYPEDSYSSATMDIDNLISEFTNIISLFKGNEDKMEEMIINDRCNSIQLTKSWIKVNNPFYCKKGGGSRVKEIRISDNWTVETSEYGQQYSYTTEEIINGKQTVISSGVAANEPGIGGDENVLKTALCKSGDKKYLSWEERGYIEGPIGESFYPGAGVGYSKITVKNLERKDGTKTLTKHATGKVVHEFFTAKDFPVKIGVTPLDVMPTVVESSKIFYSTDIKRMVVSQGYVIECNDMHGKQKSVAYYPEGAETPISGEKYFYQVNSEDQKLLDNTVDFIKKDGSVEKGLLGVDLDFVTDFRNSFTSSSNSKLKVNTATFIVFIPIPIPTAFGSGSYMERAFKTSSVTKVITRKGVLKEVQKFDASSYISSKNLAYDYETGEVLATQTNNEFDDPQYSFNYPAHWAYNQMGLAYKNTLLSFKKVDISNGIWNYAPLSISTDEAQRFFVTGDEVLMIPKTGSPIQAWILDIDRLQSRVSLINKAGAKISTMTDAEIKIMRSGRKNLATTSIGSITSLNNPIVNNNTTLRIDANTRVLTASAAEYNNVRKMFCSEKGTDPTCTKLISSGFSNLIFFLNKMIEKNALEGTGILLNQNNYASIFNSSIKAELELSNATTYTGVINEPNVNILLNDNAGTPKSIELSFTLASSFDKIVKFSNLRQVSSSCDAKRWMIDVECLDKYGNTFTTTASGFSTVTVNNTVLTGNSADPLYVFNSYPPCNSVGCRIPMNPYTNGMFGHWYPYINYAFLSKRVQNHISGSSAVDTRKDGYLENFFPFWQLNSGKDLLKNPGPGGAEKWVKQSTVTIVDPQGAEVENKDALNIYSAAIFGFNSKLAIAIAKNARKNEIGYESFEDKEVTNSCNSEQTMFRYLSAGQLNTNYSHTGRYSLKLANGNNITYYGNTNQINTEIKPSVDYLNTTDNILKDEYVYNCEDCMKTFSLKSDETNSLKYVLSFWVKDEGYNPNNPLTPVIVEAKVGGVTVNSTPVISAPIEGWQKVETIVTMPPTANSSNFDITIRPALSSSIYVDDIRIHPFNASMKSYVYNDITLKLMAELDENNYATFYEYDEEGALSRIKKETEKGVFTIKEIRKSFKKKDLTSN